MNFFHLILLHLITGIFVNCLKISKRDRGREFIPRIFGGNWWDIFDNSECSKEQYFSSNFFEDDWFSVLDQDRRQDNNGDLIYWSVIKEDNDKFQIDVNVSQFKPEELEVKVVDRNVVIHGKHKEKINENGFYSREHTRKYLLPITCQAEDVSSSLSSDGMLTILAPKSPNEAPAKKRMIPISVKEKKAIGDSK